MTHQDMRTRHQNHTTFWRKLTRSCAYTVKQMQRDIVILHADACIGTQTLTIVTNNNPRTTVYRTVIHRDNELVIAQRRICAIFVL